MELEEGTVFRESIRQANDIILLADEAGQILDANDAAVAAYGRGRRELIGLYATELFPPEAVPPAPIAGQLYESLQIRADRSTFPAEISTSRIEIAGKIFYQSIIRDITGRERADAGRNPAMLRRIADTVPALIWTVDAEGNCTYANRRFLDFTGLSSRGAMGQGWCAVIHPEDRALYLETYHAALAQRLPYEVVFRVRNADSRYRWFVDRATPGFQEDGRLDGYLELATDVTEGRESKTRMRQLSRAVDQSPAMVMITDLDGNIEYVNARFTQLTGYTAGEVLGKNPRILKSGETPPEEYRRLWRTLRSGAEWRGEFHNRKKNGEMYWEADLISPIRGPEGVFTHYLAVKEDITERRRADELIAHKNRQLHQLSRDLLRSQDYERRRIARELHDSTAQLLAAIGMNLSRVRDAELEPRRNRELLSEAIDLSGQCSREIRSVAYLLHPPLLDELGLTGALQTYVAGFRERTGIELELNISSDFGRLERDMEMTLFRIIQEGLANIRRHSGSPLAKIALERDAHEVHLALHDSGRGLATEISPGKKPSVRLGVGIPGMRERAEQLGGRLEMVSTDVGTTLTVTLPIRESDEKDTDLNS